MKLGFRVFEGILVLEIALKVYGLHHQNDVLNTDICSQ